MNAKILFVINILLFYDINIETAQLESSSASEIKTIKAARSVATCTHIHTCAPEKYKKRKRRKIGKDIHMS